MSFKNREKRGTEPLFINVNGEQKEKFRKWCKENNTNISDHVRLVVKESTGIDLKK